MLKASQNLTNRAAFTEALISRQPEMLEKIVHTYSTEWNSGVHQILKLVINNYNQQCVCIDYAFVSEKTEFETFKMVKSAFGEPCLS